MDILVTSWMRHNFMEAFRVEEVDAQKYNPKQGIQGYVI